MVELPTHPQVDKALRELADIAYDLASSNILLKHDLFGRIYHTLLLGDLAKYFATYYTSIPAARLLARLLINLPSKLRADEILPKWDNENVRIVDFACGSGTLLSAVYKELRSLIQLDMDEPDLKGLHKYLIEEGLWGFDVLQHAVHLASTTLFLHEPSQPVERSRTFALRLHKLGDEVYLGSIDFIKSPKITSKMVLTGSVVGSREVSVTDEKISEINIPKFHYCIMNPPFTRSVGGNLLFGGLPEKERKVLQEKFRELLKKYGLSGIGKAGLGAIFVFLADKYLVEGGRIGFVLPKSILQGVSWRKARELLLDKYHIEYIISSFEAPNNWNFSENTSLSEILLIARKLKNGEEKGYTIFVNLWRKPRNEIEAIFIGSQLLDVYQNSKPSDITNSNATAFPIKLYGRKIGEVYSAILDEADFGHYTFFAQSELNRVSNLLRQGILYLHSEGIVGKIPLAPLQELVKDIGPDRSQIHGTFREEGSETAFKAFWGHHTDKTTKIKQKPNVYLSPKSGKADAARELWKKSGKLLIAEGARLNTVRVLSVVTDDKVLSNVWWPIVVDDEYAKILAIWLNSTCGLLLLLSIAEVTEGAWVGFKKEHLWNLPVVDIQRLDNQQKQALLELYNKVSDEEFKPLPEEFAEPEVRKVLDDSFSRVLNIEIKFDEIYNLLSQDPMITSMPL